MRARYKAAYRAWQPTTGPVPPPTTLTSRTPAPGAPGPPTGRGASGKQAHRQLTERGSLRISSPRSSSLYHVLQTGMADVRGVGDVFSTSRSRRAPPRCRRPARGPARDLLPASDRPRHPRDRWHHQDGVKGRSPIRSSESASVRIVSPTASSRDHSRSNREWSLPRSCPRSLATWLPDRTQERLSASVHVEDELVLRVGELKRPPGQGE